MSLSFQSLRSSSSGNCLLVCSDHTCLVIDCGFKTQWECAALLAEHAGDLHQIDAVLVSHAHGDHIAYHALRVLGKHNVRIGAHGRVVSQIRDRHVRGMWESPPALQAFSTAMFRIGDLSITPFEVPHEPGVPNFGFAIQCGDGSARRKLVICTDFYDFRQVLHHFVDADFIFVESNYDLELLRRFPNHASHFHLSNTQTAMLLYRAIRASVNSPRAVMLGHLSRERNDERLALAEVAGYFQRQGTSVQFDLSAAPRREVSRRIRID